MSAAETTPAGTPAGEAAPLRLIRGDASAEEVAAIVALFAAAGGESTDDSVEPARPASRWAAPQGRVRAPHTHGPGAWRSSALPR